MNRTAFKLAMSALATAAVYLVASSALAIDQWCGASNNPIFYVIAIPACGLPASVPGFLWRRVWPAVLLPFIGIAFLLSFLVVDTGPVKPALRIVSEARPGLSEAQVRGLVAKHFPRDGRFKPPLGGPLQGDAISYTLDVSDGRWNGALLEFRFQNGDLLSAQFLPD